MKQGFLSSVETEMIIAISKKKKWVYWLYLLTSLCLQGNCLENEHSLHITISAYQLNSYTDLLEKLLPAALAVASQQDVEFRKVMETLKPVLSSASRSFRIYV